MTAVESPIALDYLASKDWPEVRRIYLEGLATGNASFETDAPEWDAWDRRHFSFCRFGAWRDGRLVGWAALSPVSDRCVYGGVAEVSLYVAHGERGQGVGTALLGRLLQQSETSGIWTLQAGIFPENAPSLALARRMGFREVGIREKIGQRDCRWRDVVLLERRSRTVGV